MNPIHVLACLDLSPRERRSADEAALLVKVLEAGLYRSRSECLSFQRAFTRTEAKRQGG